MTRPKRWMPVLLILAAAGWIGASFALDGIRMAGLLLGPPILAAVLHRPGLGLWLLLLAQPLASAYPEFGYRAVNFGIPVLVLGAWLLHLLWTRKPLKLLPGGLTPWFFLFVAWVAFASFFGAYPVRGLGVGVLYLLLFLALLAYRNLWSRRTLGRAWIAYTLVLVPIAFIAIRQVQELGLAGLLYQRAVGGPQRLSAIYDNPNTLGVVMGHGLVILGAYLLGGRRWPWTFERGVRWAAVATVALVLLAGLLVSVSRSSLLYVGAALITLGLCRPVLRGAILGGAAAAALALLLLPLPAWLHTTFRLGSGLTFREDLWSAGWRMLRDHPWTGIGVGPDVFEVHRAAYVPSPLHDDLASTLGGGAHNVFLTKGAEAGAVGLILTLTLFLLLWTRIPRALRRFRQGDWVAGAAAAGVVGLSLRAFFESGTTVGFGHLSDSLHFFLFGLVLLRPETATLAPTLVVPVERFREGRTGGQRMWRELIDRWKRQGLPVVCEDEAPVSPALRTRPHLLPLRHRLVYGRVRDAVVVADQSQGGRLALLWRHLRRRPNVRMVVVVHHLREEFRYSHPLYVRLARMNETSVLRFAHRVIVHTAEEARRVEERGVDPGRIAVIPVGVERVPDRVHVRDVEAAEPLRLLWVGGDFERKGLGPLLEAMACCPEPRPRLTVVGRPNPPGMLEEAAKQALELGVADHITFAGFVPLKVLENHYLDHDVFVQPSLHEGHGLALDEALVRGLPVAASALPVFKERLAEDEAMFFPPGDVEALAACLTRLRPAAERRRLAAAGTRRAATFPTREDTYARYDEVVREELDLVRAGREDA